jgi:hypothetical protein
MQNCIITLVFEKNGNYFAENWQKSPKIVIITSTPEFWPETRVATLDTIYQNEGMCTKLPLNYRIIPDSSNIFQMGVKCSNIFLSKAILHFWLENLPSGNPV